jgi:ferritin-like metal-binding protein YciE
MAAKRKSTQSRKESPDANELLTLELQEIHSAENQLSRVLPRLTKSIDSDKLGQMFEERLKEGTRLIEEIEAVFEEMEESPGRKKNVAAEGLINDAREHAQEISTGAALDAVLIGAMQKTEHYCIAAWGTARALAEAVGQKTAVRAMERALKEGSAFDERLSKLAEKEVMPALLASQEESEAESAEPSGLGKNGESRSRASA